MILWLFFFRVETVDLYKKKLIKKGLYHVIIFTFFVKESKFSLSWSLSLAIHSIFSSSAFLALKRTAFSFLRLSISPNFSLFFSNADSRSPIFFSRSPIFASFRTSFFFASSACFSAFFILFPRKSISFFSLSLSSSINTSL